MDARHGGLGIVVRTAIAAAAIAIFVAEPAAAQRAFLADFAVDQVAVIDTATNTPVTGSPIDLPTGAQPEAVAISPDGATAYVANSGGNTVSMINTQSLTVVGGPIAVGQLPTGIAIHPDGTRAYVANLSQGTVSVIDLTQSPPVVIATPSVGGVGQGIAVTPDGSLVLVADNGGNTVSAIETTGNTPTGSVATVGNDPGAIAIAPDGSEAFVANLASPTVSVLSLPGLTPGTAITGLDPSGSSSIAISPDGAVGLVGNRISNEIKDFDPVQNQLGTQTIGPAGLDVPEDVVIHPDGERAYATNRGDGTLVEIDLLTGAIIDSVAGGTEPSALAIVPDQVESDFDFTTAGPAAGFDGSASTATAGVDNYHWDFGDGITALSGSPSAVHLYSAPGSYQVTLRAEDEHGCSETIFTGQTAHCRAIPSQQTVPVSGVSGPPGPPGPAGSAGLAVILAQTKYRAQSRRKVTVRFATSIAGSATLLVTKGSRTVTQRSLATDAGSGSFTFKSGRSGGYGLLLSVTSADGQTATDSARLRVRSRKGSG